MALYPITTVIEIAKICQYLANVDIRSRKFSTNQVIDKRLPTLIYLTRKDVEWMYAWDPTEATLQGVVNRLYALCWPYVNQALIIMNGGGSGIIVNPSTGIESSISAIKYETQVDGSGTPVIVNGQTLVTITDDFIMVNSIQVIIDTIPIQYGVFTDRLSYTVSYSSTDAVIDFYNGSPNIGVQSGWNIEIRGLKFVAI